jgi:hypothetical protein
MEPLVITQVITIILLVLSEVMGATARGPNGMIHLVMKLFNKKITIEINDDEVK